MTEDREKPMAAHVIPASGARRRMPRSVRRMRQPEMIRPVRSVVVNRMIAQK